MSPREKITLPKIDWLVEELEPYISREINDLHINKVCPINNDIILNFPLLLTLLKPSTMLLMSMDIMQPLMLWLLLKPRMMSNPL